MTRSNQPAHPEDLPCRVTGGYLPRRLHGGSLSFMDQAIVNSLMRRGDKVLTRTCQCVGFL
jgi:hypothetical protein